VGLAVGDAVGTTLEFKPRDSYEPLRDMIGGGPFRLKPGEWTDDTSMALCLADSLIETGGQFDPADLMRRFVNWRDNGENSANERGCFDIGNATNAALKRFQRDNDPYAGSIDPNSAGNGSLMRLAPVAVRFWNERDNLREVACLQSRTTHAASEAVDACVAYADIVADAVEGKLRSEVLRSRNGPYAGKIEEIASGSWRGKTPSQIGSSGYVADSLEAALWCVASTADFETAILKAANLGGDADTTAAIAGQLAGALYGKDAIPSRWLEKLAWGKRIEERAADLFEQSVARKSGTRQRKPASAKTLERLVTNAAQSLRSTGASASKPSTPNWITMLKAADAAARCHVHQRRKGAAKEPYINHLLEVATLVAEATEGKDENLVIAALLHDAIEEEVPRELIAKSFGADVADLVAEVTDDKTLEKGERKKRQVESAHKKSDRAKVLKLADKTSNLRALVSSPAPDWSVLRRLEYIKWARTVADGLRGVNPMRETHSAGCGAISHALVAISKLIGLRPLPLSMRA
jgi:ADP-ribosylglycohydrolase